MSLECVTKYLSQQFPLILGELTNGECRFLYQNTELSTDAQGFPNAVWSPRSDATPCAWTLQRKPLSEVQTASQVRGRTGYIINVPLSADGSPIVVLTSDKCELSAYFDGISKTTKTLEIESVGSNGVQQIIYALEI